MAVERDFPLSGSTAGLSRETASGPQKGAPENGCCQEGGEALGGLHCPLCTAFSSQRGDFCSFPSKEYNIFFLGLVMAVTVCCDKQSYKCLGQNH